MFHCHSSILAESVKPSSLPRERVIHKNSSHFVEPDKLSLFAQQLGIATVQLRRYMPAKQYVNDLVRYRERIGFSQQHVAALLGLRGTALLSKLEQGRRLPTFVTALRLAAIYRVPADFLYPKLYDALREVVRARELQMAGGQQPLPMPYS